MVAVDGVHGSDRLGDRLQALLDGVEGGAAIRKVRELGGRARSLAPVDPDDAFLFTNRLMMSGIMT
jgi:hypothetical protein